MQQEPFILWYSAPIVKTKNGYIRFVFVQNYGLCLVRETPEIMHNMTENKLWKLEMLNASKKFNSMMRMDYESAISGYHDLYLDPNDFAVKSIVFAKVRNIERPAYSMIAWSKTILDQAYLFTRAPFEYLSIKYEKSHLNIEEYSNDEERMLLPKDITKSLQDISTQAQEREKNKQSKWYRQVNSSKIEDTTISWGG